MRRFRNPRYAPESLERKLHPSGLAPTVAAEYAPMATTQSVTTSVPVQDAASAATDPPVDPTDPTPPPPPDPWGNPGDPHLQTILAA